LRKQSQSAPYVPFDVPELPPRYWDIETGDYTDLAEDDIRHLEWQANYFASCLLLPRDSFVASVFEKARQMDLRDRGHGLIFLDHSQSTPVTTMR